MKTLLKILDLVLIVFCFTACASNKDEVVEATSGAWLVPVYDYATMAPSSCGRIQDTVPINPSKKTVLIIGDSISIGYTPLVRQNLDSNVLYNPCNAAYAGYTSYRIDTWLSEPNYDVIVFNNGLWDGYASGIHVDQYISNLRKTALAVKAKTTRPIFMATTYSNEIPSSMAKLNQFAVAAQNLMNELGIPVLDLYSVSYNVRSELVDGTHFTSYGYQVLANEVSDAIQSQLDL